MSTIYKRKDGRWEGRIYKENGKYISFYAPTREAIEEKISEISGISGENDFKHTLRNITYH